MLAAEEYVLAAEEIYQILTNKSLDRSIGTFAEYNFAIFLILTPTLGGKLKLTKGKWFCKTFQGSFIFFCVYGL